MTLSALQVTPLWAGLLGILAVLLAIYVVVGRNSASKLLGDGGNVDLERKIRVFGNFTEYVPLALLLMAMAELTGAASSSALHIMGAALLVGRLAHVHGLHGQKLKPTRIVGVVATWLVIVGASGYCLMAAAG